MQAEGGDQPAELRMPRVDELPAVLGHLAAGERPVGPAPAAHPVARLVEVRADAVLLQLVRARDAGESGSHHDDARIARPGAQGTGQRGERRPGDRGHGAHARTSQELPAGDQTTMQLDRFVGGDLTVEG